jgi:hypothetical protein
VSEILVEPSSLLETAPVFTSKASSVTTFGSSIDTATKSLLSSLEGSGLPLGNFLDATATLIDKAQISFECAEKNLEGIANGLATSAQEFSSTDAHLAALFTVLEGVIPEFAGYEPASLVPGQKPPAEVSPHLPPQPQHHSWWSSALSFVGHHWQYAAAGLVIAGSVGLDIVSGGTATVLTLEEADLTAGLVGAGAADATITGADMAEYDPAIEAEMERLGMRTGVASRF